MNLSYLEMLALYRGWANHLLFESAAKLPGSEIDAPRPMPFGSILKLLKHSYTIDRTFQAHLIGEPHGFTSRITPLHMTLEELRDNQRHMDEWYVAWSRRQTIESITEQVPFEFIGGGRGCMSRMEILLHVVNHSTYHRGYLSKVMQNLVDRVPATDLTIFVRDVYRDASTC
ncbi:damage-inducible protein DinB [Stenotrophomonas maltophilia]|nr:damage-inducible protein DinB [Stenotrophomonas maltophilia]